VKRRKETVVVAAAAAVEVNRLVKTGGSTTIEI
jgi:hypothetical protein